MEYFQYFYIVLLISWPYFLRYIDWSLSGVLLTKSLQKMKEKSQIFVSPMSDIAVCKMNEFVTLSS